MISTDTDSIDIMRKQYFLNLCHDMRSPLNVIMGMTSLAISELDYKKIDMMDKDKIRNYLSRVDKTSKFLLELVNNILDLSVIESGKMILNNEEFNINHLINSLYEMIEPHTSQKNQIFKIEAPQIPYPNLIGDFLRLNRILLNLLTNAVKYTACDGSIKLTMKQTSAENNKTLMEFQVSDTGIGMSDAFISRMFEPYTLDLEIKHGQSSTGLGLYITKKLVNLMGGSIHVKSKVRVGTTFTVQLPFEIVSETQHNELHDSTCGEEEKDSNLNDFDFKGKRVLIAEDNNDCMEIAAEILSYTGIDIGCAKDGLAAIRLFEASPPGYYDVILMDVSMPVMNGYIAARRIRSSIHPDAKAIPIIAMTANAFPEQAEASIEAGMNEHVSKPVNFYNLCSLLEKYFDK